MERRSLTKEDAFCLEGCEESPAAPSCADLGGMRERGREGERGRVER